MRAAPRHLSRRAFGPFAPELIALCAVGIVGACASGSAGGSGRSASTPASASAAQQRPALAGAWELVVSRVYRGDSLVAEFRPPQARSLKVLADSRFSFVTMREDGTLAQAGAGPFTAAGGASGTYTETIELTSSPARRGQTYTFSYRLDGNVWHHRGTVGELLFDEEWRRAGP